MFKTILIIFLFVLPSIFSWVRQTSIQSYVRRRNTSGYQKSALEKGTDEHTIENHLKYFPKHLLNQFSIQNLRFDKSLKSMITYLNENGVSVAVCGEILKKQENNLHLLNYLEFERYKYLKTPEDFKPEFEFLSYPHNSINYVFSFNITNWMNITVVKKITVSFWYVLKYYSFFYEIYEWPVIRIHFENDCLDTKAIYENSLEDSWTPRNQEFIDRFVRKIDDESLFAKNFKLLTRLGDHTLFLDLVDALNFITSFWKQYKFGKYKIDKLAEDIDHIVFRYLVDVENYLEDTDKQKWSFQIEAVYNNDEKWKIRKMSATNVNHQSFSEFAKNFANVFVKGTKEIILNLMKNNKTTEFLERFEDVKKIEPKMKHTILFENPSQYLRQLFEAHQNLKFQNCSPHQNPPIFLNKTEFIFQIHCESQDNWAFHRIVRIEFRAVILMSRFSIQIHSAEILPNYSIMENYKGFPDENIDEQLRVSQEISDLLISQSSFDFTNWQENSRNFTKLFESDLEFILCGQKTENIFEYLEKHRRKFRVPEKSSILHILNSPYYLDNFMFKLYYISKSFMSYEVSEMHTFSLRKINDDWKIAKIELDDECFNYPRFTAAAIKSIKTLKTSYSTWDLKRKFIERTANILPEISENREFSQNFEAIVETENNKTYNLPELVNYLEKNDICERIRGKTSDDN